MNANITLQQAVRGHIDTPVQEMGGDKTKSATVVIHDFSDPLKDHGLVLGDDGYIRWESQNPDHPRNWKLWRKVYDTGVILFLEFITLVMAYPAMKKPNHEHQLTNPVPNRTAIGTAGVGSSLCVDKHIWRTSELI